MLLLPGGWLREDNLYILKDRGLGCLYLAIFLYIKLPWVIQMFVMRERRNSHVANPNQYCFTTSDPDAPYILLEEEGPVGRFNRAQRGMDNYRETQAAVLGQVLLAGFVMPEVTLGCTVLLFIGRIVYSTSYIKKAESRGAGFGLSMAPQLPLQGIIFVAGYRALQA